MGDAAPSIGAEGEVRTRTGLPPAVFKTAASAGSATSARATGVARAWYAAGSGHRHDTGRYAGVGSLGDDQPVHARNEREEA